MRKKKLLIAGGGYADIPLILAARKLGFHVITSGNRTRDLGHRYSDECRLADFSDPTAMLKLAERLRIDAICACCNDFSALSCAYVAEKLGLPGHDPYETAKIIHHKDRYRAFARANGIPAPAAAGFADIESAHSHMMEAEYPLIVKPVDLTGGKGISVVDNPEGSRTALEIAFAKSRAGRVVVEEFVAGSRHGCSLFIRDGRVVFGFSDNEYYFKNPYLVCAASTPTTAPPRAELRLRAHAEKIVGLLALKTGIFHIQYILREGEPVIIEICRRAPGDLYIRFVEYATGVDYPAWIVRASAGLDCGGLHDAAPNGFYTRHCVMSASGGTVRNIHFDERIQENVIGKFMWWAVGDRIADVMTAKFGIVFLQFPAMAEMLDKTARMQELIRVET